MYDVMVLQCLAAHVKGQFYSAYQYYYYYVKQQTLLISSINCEWQ